MRRATRLSIAVTVTSVLTAVTAACASPTASNKPETEVLRVGDVSVLVETQEFSGSSAGVGIGGTLQLVGSRQCVGGMQGGQTVLLLFASPTRVVDVGDEAVLDVNGVRLRIGDHYDGGNRWGSLARLSDFGDLQSQVPDACRDLPVVPFDPKG
jgi:hypothetical protein